MLGPVAQHVSVILQQQKLNKILAKTSAATLGKLALLNSRLIATVSANCLKQWALSLRMINDEPDKQKSYSGFCLALVQSEPQAVASNFAFICSAFSTYKNANQELQT